MDVPQGQENIPPGIAMNISTDILHLRNHLQAAQRYLDPHSLRLNPELLDMARAEPIMTQLDLIAFQVAMTPHGYSNYFEVWRYNPAALETWFFQALNDELEKFQPENSTTVRNFLVGNPGHRALIHKTIKDKHMTGYIPTDLVRPELNTNFPNLKLELSLTGLLRPSAIFVKITSVLQDIALMSGKTDDEIWILQDDPPNTDGKSMRKCFIFLAITCALKSLLNSSITEIDPRIQMPTSRNFRFQ